MGGRGMDSSGTVQRSVAGWYEHGNETSVSETLSPTFRRTKAEGVRKEGAEKIFGSKGEEVRGNWRKVHNWSLHDVYFSAYILTVIKLRSMIGAGNIREYLGWSIYTSRVMVWRLDGKRQHERLSRGWEENINTDGGSWTWLILLRAGISRCCCDQGDETVGYIKYRGIFLIGWAARSFWRRNVPRVS